MHIELSRTAFVLQTGRYCYNNVRDELLSKTSTLLIIHHYMGHCSFLSFCRNNSWLMRHVQQIVMDIIIL